jgi:hypothetical protein
MKQRRERTGYSIMLDKDLLKALKELSAETDLSMSHWIREFIRQGLSQRISA